MYRKLFFFAFKVLIWWNCSRPCSIEALRHIMFLFDSLNVHYSVWLKSPIDCLLLPSNHGCQIPIWILQFYNPISPKRSRSFKDFCDCSRFIGSYDSNDPKWLWFLVIFFNLTECSVWPKWKIKSQWTKFFHSNIERVSVEPK